MGREDLKRFKELEEPLSAREILELRSFLASCALTEIENAPQSAKMYSFVEKSSDRYSDMRSFVNGYKKTNRFDGRALSAVILELEVASGKSAAQVYGDADISRALYSSLTCGSNKHPGRETVLALAIGLHLDEKTLPEFVEFCGYSFPGDDKGKVVLYYVKYQYVEQDVTSKSYKRGLDIMNLNRFLDAAGCKPLGYNRDNL